MFGGLGNMAGALWQLQSQAGRMGEQMKAMQQRLQDARCPGVGADGQVRVEMNGVGEVTSCRIAPSLLAGEAAAVERGVVEATNQAHAAMKELAEREMRQMTAGFDLGGLSQMLGRLKGP